MRLRTIRAWIGEDLAGSAAFVATVLAAYLSLLFDAGAQLPPGNLLAVIGLGVAYSILGMWGFDAVERRSASGRYGAAWVYLVVQLALVSVILYLSRARGFMTLLYFPLVSHVMYALPGRRALLAFALVVAAFAAPIALLASVQAALANSFTIVAGVVFVAVFTGLARRESAARREVQRLADELSEANQKLRAYMAQVEELATAKERNRVAREIHDTLGHTLTVINVQLEAAQLLLASGQPAGGSEAARSLEALHKAQTMAQQGLAEVRRSVAALRAPVEQRPLPEALRQLVEESQAAGIVTNFRLLGEARALSPQAELTLYRAAQEALTNLRKHSRASRADVTLDYGEPERVRLLVEDNGVGAAQTEPPGAFGLLGLRERVQLLDGQVRLQTAPGQGFALEVVV